MITNVKDFIGFDKHFYYAILLQLPFDVILLIKHVSLSMMKLPYKNFTPLYADYKL